MDDMTLLAVSIGVFSLTVIGLVLTIREFKNNIIVEPEESDRAAAKGGRPMPSQQSRLA